MSRRDEDFTAYVHERLPWLRRVAYLLCADWHRSDDVVQATITRLYVKWGRAQAADNTDAYVRTMLVRVYLGEQRAGWRSRVWLTAQVPDVEAHGFDADVAMDVQHALAAVPPRQRAALVLRFYCDLTVEQTADVLGCSSGNVKTLRGRRRRPVPPSGGEASQSLSNPGATDRGNRLARPNATSQSR